MINEKGWNGAQKGSERVFATYPIDDIKTHDIFDILCSCSPKIEVPYKGVTVIRHVAWDGRE